MEKIGIKILFGESEVKQFEESDDTKNLEDNIVCYSFDTENEKSIFVRIGRSIRMGGFYCNK
jgi:hypothetical protein